MKALRGPISFKAQQCQIVYGSIMALLLWGCKCVIATSAPDGDASFLMYGEAQQAYQNGLAYWAGGQWQKAEESFRQALQYAPQWEAPHAYLGALAQRKNQDAESRHHYKIVQEASLEANENVEAAARERLGEYEALLVFLVNQERKKQRLSLLVPQAALSRIARAHSAEMRDKNYFGHTSPTPGRRTCLERFWAVFGYQPQLIAENVARRYGINMNCFSEEKIRETHSELMQSPGHRRNILLPNVHLLGVGLAVNAQGDYWLTEIFVNPSH